MALASEFETAVRRQGAIPASITTADLLSVGDEEIQARFVPLLESLRSNYLVREVIVTADAVGRYQIPHNAIGAGLRNVQLQQNNVWYSLPQRQMEEPDSLTTGTPSGYYLDAGSIVLLPTGTTGTLRVRYAARPSKMGIETDSSLFKAITAVTPGTPNTTIVCGGYVGSTIIDIVSGGPAHQQKAIRTTLTASTLVPTADLLEGITPFTSVLFSGPGDVVCYPGRTPFVPLPEELFSALVHSTAANILLALGYEEATNQEGKAQACIEASRAFLIPRNEGNPQRIGGGIRGALMRRWR